jgi:hypothetical protein
MPNKNMQKLISALTLLGVIRQESWPTIPSAPSYNSGKCTRAKDRTSTRSSDEKL